MAKRPKSLKHHLESDRGVCPLALHTIKHSYHTQLEQIISSMLRRLTMGEKGLTNPIQPQKLAWI